MSKKIGKSNLFKELPKKIHRLFCMPQPVCYAQLHNKNAVIATYKMLKGQMPENIKVQKMLKSGPYFIKLTQKNCQSSLKMICYDIK